VHFLLSRRVDQDHHSERPMSWCPYRHDHLLDHALDNDHARVHALIHVHTLGHKMFETSRSTNVSGCNIILRVCATVYLAGLPLLAIIH